LGWEQYAEFHDMRVEFCGRGNGEHNFYINADHIVVDNVESGSSRHSHAFKGKPRQTIKVRNSHFWTTLEENPDPVNDPYLSSTLLDYVASVRLALIHDNVFDHYKSNVAPTGLYSLDIRRRRSQEGGALDEYYPLDENGDELVEPVIGPDGRAMLVDVSTGETVVDADGNILVPGVMTNDFWQDWFWDDAALGGMTNPENPELFRHFVWNNTFIERGDRQSVAIEHDGTAPITDRSFPVNDLPKPFYWFERAVVWVANNEYVGTPGFEALYKDTITLDTGEPHTSPLIVIGDENEEPVPLPEWWPTRLESSSSFTPGF
jgi:hypothetical protein